MTPLSSLTRIVPTRFLAEHGFSSAGGSWFHRLFRRVHASHAPETGGA